MVYLRAADPDLPAKTAGLLCQAPDVLELGLIARLCGETQGVDDHAGTRPALTTGSWS
jgi:hypothetical protein